MHLESHYHDINLHFPNRLLCYTGVLKKHLLVIRSFGDVRDIKLHVPTYPGKVDHNKRLLLRCLHHF